MNSPLVTSVVIFLNFSPALCSKKFDVEDFISQHSNCNGEPVIVPFDIVTGAVLAATKCLDVTEDSCGKLCTAYNYDEMIKENKFNAKWLKQKLLQRVEFPNNEQAKANLLAVVDTCGNPYPEMVQPDSRTESCPEFTKFEDCLEENWQVQCKGKLPKSATDFLDKSIQ